MTAVAGSFCPPWCLEHNSIGVDEDHWRRLIDDPGLTLTLQRWRDPERRGHILALDVLDDEGSLLTREQAVRLAAALLEAVRLADVEWSGREAVAGMFDTGVPA